MIPRPKEPLFLHIAKEEAAMNDFEKRRIVELKEAGNGYGNIAKELGLSKSTVSSYLKSLEGNKTCKCCGAKFTQPAGVRLKMFCCDKCRFKYRRLLKKGKPMTSGYQAECLCCHKKFYSYRSQKRKFCSRACYDLYRKGGGDDGSE